MFKEKVIKELAKNGIEADSCEIVKNGVKKTGITVKKNDGISPVVYLEDFTGTAEEIAAEMADVFKRYAGKDLGFDANLFKKPECMLEKIRIALQRTSEEADLVKAESGFPGIEKYLYLKLGETMTSKVKNGILAAVGITEQEAWNAAERNTFAFGETRIESLLEMLGIPSEAAEGPVMYVISNRDGNRGSSAVLDTQAIRKYFGDNKRFVVFPSSIHECILVEKEELQGKDELDAMVQQINAAEVAPEEQLGDCTFEIAV